MTPADYIQHLEAILLRIHARLEHATCAGVETWPEYHWLKDFSAARKAKGENG